MFLFPTFDILGVPTCSHGGKDAIFWVMTGWGISQNGIFAIFHHQNLYSYQKITSFSNKFWQTNKISLQNSENLANFKQTNTFSIDKCRKNLFRLHFFENFLARKVRNNWFLIIYWLFYSRCSDFWSYTFSNLCS